MKKIQMLLSFFALSVMSSAMGMEGPAADAAHSEALTPRTADRVTTTFLNIVGELAEENPKYKMSQEVVKTSEEPSVSKKVFSFANETNGTQVKGEFPDTTKNSEVLGILSKIAAKDPTYLITIQCDSLTENTFVRQVADPENKWFILAGFSLPPQSEAVSEVKEELVVEETRRKNLGQQVEKVFQRARDNLRKVDMDKEAKRVEHWAKDEARPKIEQEARNTGKALEAAGKNVGKFFGRKK
jgi:hypothetical protein